MQHSGSLTECTINGVVPGGSHLFNSCSLSMAAYRLARHAFEKRALMKSESIVYVVAEQLYIMSRRMLGVVRAALLGWLLHRHWQSFVTGIVSACYGRLTACRWCAHSTQDSQVCLLMLPLHICSIARYNLHALWHHYTYAMLTIVSTACLPL